MPLRLGLHCAGALPTAHCPSCLVAEHWQMLSWVAILSPNPANPQPGMTTGEKKLNEKNSTTAPFDFYLMKSLVYTGLPNTTTEQQQVTCMHCTPDMS